MRRSPTCSSRKLALALASLAVVLATGGGLDARQDASFDYLIGPQDVLSITVFDEPGLQCSCTVDADGTITFPLINRVTVEGLTLREIQTAIETRLLDGYLVNPQVTVDIEQYRSQSVYVLGEVASPGIYRLEGNLSLIEVLVQAGGATAQAGNMVQIIRPRGEPSGAGPVLADDEDDDVEVTEVSLEDIRTGRLALATLRDGDTVYVPKAATFYVLGEVNSPGSFVWSRGMSVRQAIALAGGYTPRGSTRGLRIIRNVDGEAVEVSVEQNDLVQANDTVQVRRRLF